MTTLSDKDQALVRNIMFNVKDNFKQILIIGKDNYIDEEISTLNNRVEGKTLKPEVENKLRSIYSIAIDKILEKVLV